jgi:branched-subunit amino acid transport protein AzlD
MGAVILFCRALPFLLFREKEEDKAETDGAKPDGATPEGEPPNSVPRLLSLAEKTVPPVAMTVLAFNALAGPVKTEPAQALPVLAAAALTALLHLWKRNALVSIAAGTALYMLLERVV